MLSVFCLNKHSFFTFKKLQILMGNFPLLKNNNFPIMGFAQGYYFELFR